MSKKVLVGCLVKNSVPFLDGLFSQLLKIDYPKEFLRFVFFENDSEDASFVRLASTFCPRLCRNGLETILVKYDFGFKLKHGHRHLKGVQPKRMDCIAHARQYIIDWFSDGFDFIWWVDSDLKVIPPNALKRLLENDVDCVLPKYLLSDGSWYDDASHSGKVHVRHILGKEKEKRLIKLDGTNCQALMRRSIFDIPGCAFWISGEKNSNTIQSYRMVKNGFSIFLDRSVPIIHHSVCGTKPMR
jgi:hypothetical protein